MRFHLFLNWYTFTANSLDPLLHILLNILSDHNPTRPRSRVFVILPQRFYSMTRPYAPRLQARRRATDNSIHNHSLVAPLGARLQDALEAIRSRVSERVCWTREPVLAVRGIVIFGRW